MVNKTHLCSVKNCNNKATVEWLANTGDGNLQTIYRCDRHPMHKVTDKQDLTRKKANGFSELVSWVYSNRLVLLVGAIAIFTVFIWPHTSEWDGEGEISVFSNTDKVKNYRMPANMTVTDYKRGWFETGEEYSAITGQWPNGGSLRLPNCTVLKDSSTQCTDSNGDLYTIEVTKRPNPPEAGYEDSGY